MGANRTLYIANVILDHVSMQSLLYQSINTWDGVKILSKNMYYYYLTLLLLLTLQNLWLANGDIDLPSLSPQPFTHLLPVRELFDVEVDGSAVFSPIPTDVS